MSLSSTQRVEIESLVSSPGWSVVPATALPSAFPPDFRRKIDSALVVSAPTSTGGTYLVVSAHRVDRRDVAIDIEPFGVIVNTTGSSTAAVFVHDGDWEGRTRDAPDGFWEQVEVSGIGGYFLARPPDGTAAGALDELPLGDRGAFDAAVRELRRAKGR